MLIGVLVLITHTEASAKCLLVSYHTSSLREVTCSEKQMPRITRHPHRGAVVAQATSLGLGRRIFGRIGRQEHGPR